MTRLDSLDCGLWPSFCSRTFHRRSPPQHQRQKSNDCQMIFGKSNATRTQRYAAVSSTSSVRLTIHTALLLTATVGQLTSGIEVTSATMKLTQSAAALSASTIAVVLSATSIVQGASASRVERQAVDRSLANDKTWTTTEEGNCWE